MTYARAAWLAGALAAAAYLPGLANRYPLDDAPVVERNVAAHSVPAALRAFGQSYWPPENGAGQWRPLVILSFAVDWQLSGGSAAWLHAGNALWHAAATGLLVLVAAPYVTPAAALAAGAIFALHPVHVEAVAGLVGRAELMAAAFLFLAILAARAVRRRAAAGRATWPAEAGLFASVACGLLSKEHAALAVALLLLDDLGTRDPDAAIGAPRLPVRDYVAVVALTAVWFVIRRPIDAGRSFAMVAPAFFGLGAAGRISTMLPVVFVLVRLLVWPFDLSPDYDPQVVPRLEHFAALSAAGLAFLLALAALAVVTWKRSRAVSVGLFLIGIAWIPTSNLLFPTGVVMAERTLYLASAGAALAAGALFDWVVRRRGTREAWAVLLVVALAFAARSEAQIPVWRSNRDLVLWALEAHPEAYREHQAAARALVRLGAPGPALAEYGTAIELYPLDHYTLTEAGATALDAGQPRLAVRYLAAAARLEPGYRPARDLLERARQAISPPRALSRGPRPAPRAR